MGNQRDKYVYYIVQKIFGEFMGIYTNLYEFMRIYLVLDVAQV